MKTYDEAVASTWRHTEPQSDDNSRLQEIVRYATLAPSSHNTQCWKFRINNAKNTVTVLPDFDRQCPAVDPDDHHLYVTLGCAVENLVIAAKALGLAAEVDASSPREGIHVQFTPCPKDPSDLFEVIPKRQCTRGDYDGKRLSALELEQLEQAGQGNGVRAVLLTDADKIETVADYVVMANRNQMMDKMFKEELKHWLRFSDSEAITKGDGLIGKCFGNSASAPRWLGALIFNFIVGPEDEKFYKQVRNSAGIAVFLSDKDDPAHWVEVGRCYERFALRATVLGVRNSMVNQPIEEQETRPKFMEALGLKGARADLVVRFGRGPEMPRSLRRPVQDVIEFED